MWGDDPIFYIIFFRWVETFKGICLSRSVVPNNRPPTSSVLMDHFQGIGPQFSDSWCLWNHLNSSWLFHTVNSNWVPKTNYFENHILTCGYCINVKFEGCFFRPWSLELVKLFCSALFISFSCQDNHSLRRSHPMKLWRRRSRAIKEPMSLFGSLLFSADMTLKLANNVSTVMCIFKFADMFS